MDKNPQKDLKKGTLDEPLYMVLNTEKSIQIDEGHMAVIGTVLDRNLEPETIVDSKTGEVAERKVAIIVDGPPQRNGDMRAYYRNPASYETREMLVAQALDPMNTNPPTRIGASLIGYHDVKAADHDIRDDETGISYPAYSASRYCNRVGITPEDAKKRVFYGMRAKMVVKDRDTENQRISFEGYDLRKQVRISEVHDNKENLRIKLGEVFDHIAEQYRDTSFNKGAVVLSFFAKTKEGELKRIGKMTQVNGENGKKSWEYNENPYTHLTYGIDNGNKAKRVQRDRNEFVNETMKGVERVLDKFEHLDIVVTPKFTMDLDNLSKEKFRMPAKLIDMLSSDFYNGVFHTSPNRTFKSFQFFQHGKQSVPYNIHSDIRSEVPVMTFEEYEQAQKPRQQAGYQQTSVQETVEAPAKAEDDAPFGPAF